MSVVNKQKCRGLIMKYRRLALNYSEVSTKSAEIGVETSKVSKTVIVRRCCSAANQLSADLSSIGRRPTKSLIAKAFLVAKKKLIIYIVSLRKSSNLKVRTFSCLFTFIITQIPNFEKQIFTHNLFLTKTIQKYISLFTHYIFVLYYNFLNNNF